MTVVDLAVVGAVLLSGVMAYARGFVQSALSLAAWVLSGLASLWLLDWAGSLVMPLVGDSVIARAVGALCVFVAAIVILTFAIVPLASVIAASVLAPLDRALGFIFGAIRGLVVVSALYIFLFASGLVFTECPEYVRNARTLPVVLYGAHMLAVMAPETVQMTNHGCSARGAADAGELLRRMEEPAPKPPAEEGEVGYAGQDRKEFDRLINIESGTGEEGGEP